MKRTLRLIIAILLVIFSIGFILFFEFYAKEKIDTVPVIVATKTIEFKEPITEKNIAIKYVRRGTEVENHIPPTRYKSLIGKYASVKIEKGTQLYSALVDTYDLVPDAKKGEFIASIPKEWLFAVPGSIRRTYIADIYVVGDKEQAVIRSLIKDAPQESGEENKEAANNNEIIQTNIKPNSAAILTNVRVASVKDNSNREVKESEETKEATGQVSSLEIVATEDMLNTIKQYTEQGYKLYVVYKFDRGDKSNE
jgi:hypothetical protein